MQPTIQLEQPVIVMCRYKSSDEGCVKYVDTSEQFSEGITRCGV